jgi:hypothetical protein
MSVPPAHPLPVGPAAVTPLSPDRYKLQLTIGGETLEKLRLAKDMLGHAIPSGDDAAILDRALGALLVELAKKKFSDTRKPRPSYGTKAGARDPSAQVKRAVWLRDLGRCAFVGTSHRCCISTSAGAEALAGSCERNRHGTGLATRHRRNLFAVGTPVARRPPRRSQHAELPHWAPASGRKA